MATKQELEVQLAEAKNALAIEQAVNARMADLVGKQAVQVKATKKAVATRVIGDTYNNEEIVGFVKVGTVRSTKNGFGKMVNFNGTPRNQLKFVKESALKHLKAGKEYPVTLHTSKTSGKTTHAIYLNGKTSAVYCAIKK